MCCMVERLKQTLPSLYEQDETAWLEVMAELAAQKRFEDMDCENLREYLESMAKRDKREVRSRLRSLLAHLLKWEYQQGQRTTSWKLTIRQQRRALQDLLESGTLRRHAEAIFADTYREAVDDAADEAGLPASSFPDKSRRGLDQTLSEELAD